MTSSFDQYSCYISPNNPVVIIIEKATFTAIYMAYLIDALQKYGQRFPKLYKRQFCYFGVILCLNTAFAILTHIIYRLNDYPNVLYILDQLKGLSNEIEHQSIKLLFLYQMSKLQLIFISLDERNQSVETVIKKIRSNQRNTNVIFYVMVSIMLLYIFF